MAQHYMEKQRQSNHRGFYVVYQRLMFRAIAIYENIFQEEKLNN